MDVVDDTIYGDISDEEDDDPNPMVVVAWEEDEGLEVFFGIRVWDGGGSMKANSWWSEKKRKEL